MILDRLNDSDMYTCLGARFQAAFSFLKETDLMALPAGRHEILGDECYAIKSDSMTVSAEQGAWEAHRRYCDIQYVVDGTERMGYANVSALSPSTDYDEKGDCVMLKGDGTFFDVSQGMFAIFAPQDAHMPCLAPGEPSRVVKIIIKIKVG